MRFRGFFPCCLHPTSAHSSAPQEQDNGWVETPYVSKNSPHDVLHLGQVDPVPAKETASTAGVTANETNATGAQVSPLFELLTTTQAMCLLRTSSAHALYKASCADGRLLIVQLSLVSNSSNTASWHLGNAIGAHKFIFWSASKPCVLSSTDLDATTYLLTKSPCEAKAGPPLMNLQLFDDKRTVDSGGHAASLTQSPAQAVPPSGATNRPPVSCLSSAAACIPPGRRGGQRLPSFLGHGSAFLRMKTLLNRRHGVGFEASTAPSSGLQINAAASAAAASSSGAGAAAVTAVAAGTTTAVQELPVQQPVASACGTSPDATGMPPSRMAVLAACTSMGDICIDTTTPSATVASFVELERSAFSTPAAASVMTGSTQHRPHTLSSFLTGATGGTVEEDEPGHNNTGDVAFSCGALRTGSGMLLQPSSFHLSGTMGWGQPLHCLPLHHTQQQQVRVSAPHEAGVLLVLQWLQDIGARPGSKLLISVSEWCDSGTLQQALACPRPSILGWAFLGSTSSVGGDTSPGWAANDHGTRGPPFASLRRGPRRSQTLDGPALAGKESPGNHSDRPTAQPTTQRRPAARPSTAVGADSAAAAPVHSLAITEKLSSGQRKVVMRKAEVMAALRFAVQVAEALAHLHEAGFYHTNLNPTSIFCCPLPSTQSQACGHSQLEAAAFLTGTADTASPAHLQVAVEQLVSAAPLGRVFCKLAIHDQVAPISASGCRGSDAAPKAHEALLAAFTAATTSPHISAAGQSSLVPTSSPAIREAAPTLRSHTGSTPSVELSLNTAHWRALAYVAPEVVRGGQPQAAEQGCAAAPAAAAGVLTKYAAGKWRAASPGARCGASEVNGATVSPEQPRAEWGLLPALTRRIQDVVPEQQRDMQNSPGDEARGGTPPQQRQQRRRQQLAMVNHPCGSADNQTAGPAAAAAAAAPGPAANAFTYGMILWQLLTGRTPYFELHPAQILVGKVTGDLDSSLAWPEDIDDEVRRLGETCLDRVPSRRPLMRSASEALAPVIERLAVEIRQVLQLAQLPEAVLAARVLQAGRVTVSSRR